MRIPEIEIISGFSLTEYLKLKQMKPKLRAEIQKLANALLKEEQSGDTAALKKATRELYEKLSVLEYLEDQLTGGVSNLVDKEAESLDSKSFREQNWFKEPEPVPQPENQEALVEPVMEKIKDIVAQMPEESQQVDAMLEEVLPKKEYHKNDLEEFASTYQETPVFERKDSEPNMEKITITNTSQEELEEERPTTIANTTDKPASINDRVNKGLHVGLNDRLAFIKHLFDGKTEDYTRVLSQIGTMQSYDQAENFIKGKVKPDYNYWLKKDEFADRFMKIVEKSFN